MNNKIVNIAVIAHVDAGKSTLVDAFLSQSGVFRDNEEVVDCVMDSNDLERERGITIYSKNCSVLYNDTKINIVDTPGHADFSSEVERIIKTVDTVILLVDSSEGPMPQTRFVLQKSLEMGLKPILLINKIDKKDQRAEEVVDEVFDLFVELDANEEQLDFPILYGVARDGIVKYELDDDNEDIIPLFDTILKHADCYPQLNEENLQIQISSLAYDEYIGRLGIGRIFKGSIKEGQNVSVYKRNGELEKCKVGKLFTYMGLNRISVKEALSGDIVVISGLSDISIGETIGLPDKVEPLPMINIEEPTLSMNFLVNSSPFSSRDGKFVTTRHIKARLEKELEVNVGLKVEEIPNNAEGFKVSGRGELHLSILIENMRREGYELSVSKPEVIFHKENGKTMEPIEKVFLEVPDEYSGAVIQKLNLRKGELTYMLQENGYTTLNYDVPTRGLIGYRSEFINDTRGEGTIIRRFERYDNFKGEIPGRKNGVLISIETGTAMTYALSNLSDRAQLFVEPAQEVYEGMIIGINSRNEDMTVNPCKNKKLTNMRASGSDDAAKIIAYKKMNLEESLEFIEVDELLEVTPNSLRLRKKFLSENDRKKNYRNK
ncbi:GTP-binding protein [Dethiosulfatibacter aminovorans DSM 17477]|uniref:Large ribosomal subunit assembly factor BipA n=1 Tax=Dethiosulfatibacter aminovorans DSM 17477 TaxID=1121476 RepID=A0A1M6D0Z8_9FIRM|nr:translational GTPase TypA [Dethiosulfatibacter aminovorans]SHI66890.1 GTP-binding protein [Dethiosulfatibacter aminovorans DSM 17477]